MPSPRTFLAPTFIERWFNKLFGFFAGRAIGLSHNYQLSARGQKTGKRYSTPVNVTHIDGEDFLVSPRGEAQWIRNVRVSGELWLRRGKDNARYRVEEVEGAQKIEVLREYLSRYATTVQRYFLVQPASPDEEFIKIAHRHPVMRIHKD